MRQDFILLSFLINHADPKIWIFAPKINLAVLGLVIVASFFEFSCQNCLSGKISQLQVIVPKVSNIYSKAMTMLQNGHLAVLK